MRSGGIGRLIRGPALVMIIVAGLTVGVAALSVASRPTEYTSVSRVLVTAEQQTKGGTPAPPAMGTEREIALSGSVARRAGRALSSSAPSALTHLDVGVKVDANVLEFTYTAGTAAEAQLGARAFSRSYARYRNNGNVTNAEIITPASFPQEPDSPNYALILGAGAVVGLLLGLALAVARRHLSPWLQGPADVVRQSGLPDLGSIPKMPASGRKLIVGRTATPGAEVYGHLAARVEGLAEQRSARTLVMTSPREHAGKGVVTANLVTSLAMMGRRVIAVCVDDGDDALTTVMGVASRPGLRDVIDNSSSLDEAVHDTGIEGLAILPYGGSGDVPVTLTAIDSVVQKLADSVDLVVVEAPVVLGNARTATMATRADMVIVVVDARRGRRSDLKAAAAALAHVGDRLVGCLSNDPVRRPSWVQSSTRAKPEPESAPSDQR